MKAYLGNGLLNSAINALPFEMQIPGYNYCGLATKFQKRLERGDLPINKLDGACKDHDITYSQEKYLMKRNVVGKVLAEKAMNRFRSKDASFGEKMAGKIEHKYTKHKKQLIH